MCRTWSSRAVVVCCSSCSFSKAFRLLNRCFQACMIAAGCWGAWAKAGSAISHRPTAAESIALAGWVCRRPMLPAARCPTGPGQHLALEVKGLSAGLWHRCGGRCQQVHAAAPLYGALQHACSGRPLAAVRVRPVDPASKCEFIRIQLAGWPRMNRKDVLCVHASHTM